MPVRSWREGEAGSGWRVGDVSFLPPNRCMDSGHSSGRDSESLYVGQAASTPREVWGVTVAPGFLGTRMVPGPRQLTAPAPPVLS